MQHKRRIARTIASCSIEVRVLLILGLTWAFVGASGAMTIAHAASDELVEAINRCDVPPFDHHSGKKQVLVYLQNYDRLVASSFASPYGESPHRPKGDGYTFKEDVLQRRFGVDAFSGGAVCAEVTRVAELEGGFGYVHRADASLDFGQMVGAIHGMEWHGYTVNVRYHDGLSKMVVDLRRDGRVLIARGSRSSDEPPRKPDRSYDRRTTPSQGSAREREAPKAAPTRKPDIRSAPTRDATESKQEAATPSERRGATVALEKGGESVLYHVKAARRTHSSSGDPYQYSIYFEFQNLDFTSRTRVMPADVKRLTDFRWGVDTSGNRHRVCSVHLRSGHKFEDVMIFWSGIAGSLVWDQTEPSTFVDWSGVRSVDFFGY